MAPLNVSLLLLLLGCGYCNSQHICKPAGLIDHVQIEKLNFILHIDSCHNVSVPLTRAADLWNTPGFDRKRPTVIFITGFTTNIASWIDSPITKAYLCRNRSNFVVLDTAHYLGSASTLEEYTDASVNAQDIGKSVAKALLQLDSNYVSSQVHLVGHSLGAQIAGNIGRTYTKLTGGKLFNRITGLDPAGLCFYSTHPYELQGLSKGDAEFVDLIHTSRLGIRQPKADVDFFPAGRDRYQPGCDTGNTDSYRCSHSRATQFWVETVYPNNTRNFLGRGCAFGDLQGDYSACNGPSAIMGYAANSSALGVFYVGVNAEEPFGQQADKDNYTHSNSSCGVCKTGF